MKNLTRTLLLLLAVVVAQGCTELLERTNPADAISQEIALTDPGAVAALRAGMYDEFHDGNYSTELMLGPESLADNLVQGPGSSRNEGFHQNQHGAGLDSWTTAYDAINKANLLIHAVDDEVFADDPETLIMYQGEAYFVRAFAMHHLVRVLGYEPGMTPATGEGAGWTEGIIIRTEPTLDVSDAEFFARSSVTEVYTQIKSDLQQAITLLSQSQAPSRQNIQEAAAHGLLARVYLYERSWAEADASAQDALDATTASLVTTQAGVATMFDETVGVHPEGIFVVDFNPDTESLGTNNSLAAFTAMQWNATVPPQDLIDLYDAADWRNAWYGPCFDDINGTAIVGCDSGLEIQKWNAEQGSFADDVPILRVAEMILIQAEARLNTTGGAAAALRLNDLRAARGLGALATATIDDILDERRREFAAEGHRFFDLKRLGMDIRKPPSVPYPTVPFSDYRVLDNISDDFIELNPLLVQNPGY